MKPGLRLWRSSQGPGYGAKRSKGQGSRGRFLHKQQLEMGGLLKRLKRLSFAASCAVSCCLDFACRCPGPPAKSSGAVARQRWSACCSAWPSALGPRRMEGLKGSSIFGSEDIKT